MTIIWSEPEQHTETEQKNVQQFLKFCLLFLSS